MPSKAPAEMHATVMHDNAIACMTDHSGEATAVARRYLPSNPMVLAAASNRSARRDVPELMRRWMSVHPAPHNGCPRRDNGTGRTNDRPRHDGGPDNGSASGSAGGDTASANHAAS